MAMIIIKNYIVEIYLVVHAVRNFIYIKPDFIRLMVPVYFWTQTL